MNFGTFLRFLIVSLSKIARFIGFALPLRHTLSHALLEGEGEGVVVAVAALGSQLLDGEKTLGSDGLAVEVDEMFLLSYNLTPIEVLTNQSFR